jgi:hypothetical protein
MGIIFATLAAFARFANVNFIKKRRSSFQTKNGHVCHSRLRGNDTCPKIIWIGIAIGIAPAHNF